MDTYRRQHDRPGYGPMNFRIVLQPLMAMFFAVRSGLADAIAGRPPYFWTPLSDPGEREAMLKDGRVLAGY